MLAYHGTSKANAKLISKYGFMKNEDSMNIDNAGISTFINAVFVTPNKDIAHIYECDNRQNGSLILEINIDDDARILDLTNKDIQKRTIEMLKTGMCINEILDSEGYDGCKQYHKNDYGNKRLEYAIVNIDIIEIVDIPKKETSFMSLYCEAMERDVIPSDYL